MSFAKLTQEQLDTMFPNQQVEIIHEGGSSKISREKATRNGIKNFDKFLAVTSKLEQAKAELTALLKEEKCFYIVDGIPTKTLVGHDWYMQNIDKPDSKLVEKVRKARANNLSDEIEEETEDNQ